jgi:hypothetical protein
MDFYINMCARVCVCVCVCVCVAADLGMDEAAHDDVHEGFDLKVVRHHAELERDALQTGVDTTPALKLFQG